MQKPQRKASVNLVTHGTFNDAGNADRLVQNFGEELRHLYATNTWYAWCGTHWAPDASGVVWQRGIDTARRIYASAERAINKELAVELGKHGNRSQSASRISAMIELARSNPTVAVTREQLDSNPWLLNVRNGTLDLQTGNLRPHSRDDLITRCAPVDYDPNATCETFERFLGEALPDENVRAYVQRFVGYSITAVIREHVLVVFWGEGGRNGKGTLTNALKNVLGRYYTQAPRDLLMQSHGDKHLTGLTMLDGARLAVASETQTGAAFDQALVKQLCGGDPITANRMRQDHYTFDPTAKILLVTNPKPRVKDDDPATWARIHLVPWLVSFAGREDTSLGAKIAAEASGILRWAVEGCMEWQRIGLAPPDAVKHATEAYREEQDPLGEFFIEACEFDPDASVARKDMFECYERWAKAEGIRHPLSAKSFAQRLSARLKTELGGSFDVETRVRDDYGTPVRGWRGVRIAAEWVSL
jgi:putative DNA primase/helicase